MLRIKADCNDVTLPSNTKILVQGCMFKSSANPFRIATIPDTTPRMKLLIQMEVDSRVQTLAQFDTFDFSSKLTGYDNGFFSMIKVLRALSGLQTSKSALVIF